MRNADFKHQKPKMGAYFVRSPKSTWVAISRAIYGHSNQAQNLALWNTGTDLVAGTLIRYQPQAQHKVVLKKQRSVASLGTSQQGLSTYTIKSRQVKWPAVANAIYGSQERLAELKSLNPNAKLTRGNGIRYKNTKAQPASGRGIASILDIHNTHSYNGSFKHLILEPEKKAQKLIKTTAVASRSYSSLTGIYKIKYKGNTWKSISEYLYGHANNEEILRNWNRNMPLKVGTAVLYQKNLESAMTAQTRNIDSKDHRVLTEIEMEYRLLSQKNRSKNDIKKRLIPKTAFTVAGSKLNSFYSTSGNQKWSDLSQKIFNLKSQANNLKKWNPKVINPTVKGQLIFYPSPNRPAGDSRMVAYVFDHKNANGLNMPKQSQVLASLKSQDTGMGQRMPASMAGKIKKLSMGTEAASSSNPLLARLLLLTVFALLFLVPFFIGLWKNTAK